MKKLSKWTLSWLIIIILLILYPVSWLLIELIKGSPLLYELPITFGFFGILILISLAIWGIGIWIKQKK